jgi:tetraacyldisaccharide 4'-kinase
MPLSWIYSKFTGLRNRLYDRGLLEAVDLRARTISVGNLTTGGTGKTPLVAHIAKILLARGEKVCILTRGYKRDEPRKRILVANGEHILADANVAGDEPFELAQKLEGKAIIIADADRRSAGEWAKRKFGVTAFILEDGFQHRQVRRDVDIVCIDATEPWGGGKTLPLGRLREPKSGLGRADIVVITRSDLSDQISDLKSEIPDLNPDADVFEARNKIVSVVPANGENVGEDALFDRAQPALAFCAIGNPGSFFEQLKNEGFELAATKAFRDHHRYSQADADALEEQAAAVGAKAFLTTAKDAVKLAEITFSLPCFVVEIDVVIDGAEKFEALI